MQINKLTLTNFRNHKEAEFEFSPETTFLVGLNASGKTNVLESISLLTHPHPLRGTYDVDLIAEGESHMRIVGQAEGAGRDLCLEVFLERRGESNYTLKKVWVNKVARSQINFSGQFKAVTFLPSHIDLFSRSPSARRKMMDTLFTQTSKEYLLAKRLYDKALLQRNKLLDLIWQTGRGEETLPYWSDQLVSSARIIQEHRASFFDFLAGFLAVRWSELDTTSAPPSIDYQRNEINEARLAKYRDRERAARRTLIGPQRDDVRFTLHGRDLIDFGSRGEQRSVLLLWKMGELAYIEQETGERPILLLDDIFSEFDDTHRVNVLKLLGQQQTIVTTTDLEKVGDGAVARSEILRL